jgi:aspartate racemase
MNVASSRTSQVKTFAHPNAAPVSGAEKPMVNGAHAPRKFSTRARFDNSKEAADFVAKEYIPGLSEYAAEFKLKNGRAAKDQDFPVELIRMVPPNPIHPPLLIVGGMGPLAGAQAFQDALKMFQDALQKFGDKREIVLLQLCDVPDRTAALNADAKVVGGQSEEHKNVVAKMAAGLVGAEVNALETAPQFGMAHVVVACNTAHNFVPEAFREYQQQRVQNGQLKLDSMVECVTAELSKPQAGKVSSVIILGTDGTLKTGLYINPLGKRGVKCAVPDKAGQDLLMRAIYEGVKGFDTAKTIEHGEALFRNLAATGQIKPGEPFVVLAACTEVPEIINVLKAQGSPEIKALLANVQVKDPMNITLAQIASTDEMPATGQLMAKQ